jgi:hypothetical protein
VTTPAFVVVWDYAAIGKKSVATTATADARKSVRALFIVAPGPG